MAKHLIIVGFAKCGTSLLNEVLKQSNEFCTPRYKEINYFNRHWQNSLDLSWYYEQYVDKEGILPEDKIFVDASPTYLSQSYTQTLERIKSSLKDAKILVCLRNPVYRAFSHYIHNINAHFARNGHFFKRQNNDFQEIYNQSFYEAFQNDSDLKDSYSNKIKKIYKIFGKSNVAFFSLEDDSKNFVGFYKKLCHFCGIKYRPYFEGKSLPRVLTGNSISHYLYSGNKNLLISHENKLFSIKKDTMFLVNPRQNEIFRDLSQLKILEILSSSYNWTDFLHEETAKRIFEENFTKTSQQIEDLIDGLDLSSWKIFKDKHIAKATFCPQYLDNGKLCWAVEVDYRLHPIEALQLATVKTTD